MIFFFLLQLSMRGLPGPIGLSGRSGPLVSYKPFYFFPNTILTCFLISVYHQVLTWFLVSGQHWDLNPFHLQIFTVLRFNLWIISKYQSSNKCGKPLNNQISQFQGFMACFCLQGGPGTPGRKGDSGLYGPQVL